MMCFRDMTFCAAKCATADCPRQYTAEVSAAARRWWDDKDGAPIAMADLSGGCPDFAPLEGEESHG